MNVREYFANIMHAVFPYEKMQVPRRQTIYCYKEGPMFFLGQQIVKAMEDAGYPAKISECYRSAARQDELKAKGRSKASAGQSPHQYYEAVDIIHPAKGWQVSDKYWDALNACARMVANRYGVTLEYGYDWGWDKAHIELKDWRDARVGLYAWQKPTAEQLWVRFERVLPDIAKRCAREGRHR